LAERRDMNNPRELLELAVQRADPEVTRAARQLWRAYSRPRIFPREARHADGSQGSRTSTSTDRILWHVQGFGVAAAFVKPPAQQGDGVFGQWGDALLAALALGDDVRARACCGCQGD
jgi:hypothetical protein